MRFTLKAITCTTAIILSLSTTGCVVNKSPGVNGVITDAETHKPIPDAKVSFKYGTPIPESEKAKTNAQGEFSIDKTSTYMFGLFLFVHSNWNPYISGETSQTLIIEAENHKTLEIYTPIEFMKIVDSKTMSQEAIDEAHRKNIYPLGEISLKQTPSQATPQPSHNQIRY